MFCNFQFCRTLKSIFKTYAGETPNADSSCLKRPPLLLQALQGSVLQGSITPVLFTPVQSVWRFAKLFQRESVCLGSDETLGNSTKFGSSKKHIRLREDSVKTVVLYFDVNSRKLKCMYIARQALEYVKNEPSGRPTRPGEAGF